MSWYEKLTPHVIPGLHARLFQPITINIFCGYQCATIPKKMLCNVCLHFKGLNIILANNHYRFVLFSLCENFVCTGGRKIVRMPQNHDHPLLPSRAWPCIFQYKLACVMLAGLNISWRAYVLAQKKQCQRQGFVRRLGGRVILTWLMRTESNLTFFGKCWAKIEQLTQLFLVHVGKDPDIPSGLVAILTCN